MTFDFTVKEFILGNGTGTPTFQFYRRGFVLNGSGGSTPTWQDIILSGNTALTLVNAKANGLNYLKLFGGTEQRNLPKGYTQYEYLRSTGTQYIDLGYKGNGNTKVKIKLRYHTATSATGSGRVFGSRTSSSSNAFAIGSSSGLVSAEGTNNVFWCYDGQPYQVDDTEFGLDVWKTVVFSATEHTIDGVTVGNDYTVTEFETPYNLKLFGFENNGTIGVGYVDIAYCQLWDDGVLVRDVVPAGDGTTYSMYDFVSGAMLPNAGTGTFEVGNATVPTPEMPIDIVCNNGVLKFGVLSTNLLDLANCTDGYYYTPAGEYAATPNARLSNYIPVKAGVTYTVGLTGTEGQSNVRINLFDTAKNWLSQTVFVSYAGEKRTQSITPTQDGFLAFSANYLSSSRVDWNTAQVVQGSYTVETMPEYEPYRTGIRTDGTTEKVEVIGKNLYNKNASQIGYYNKSDGTFDSNSNYKHSEFIPIQGNNEYTQSGINGLYGGKNKTFCWYGEDYSYISSVSKYVGEVGSSWTLTATSPANAKYVVLCSAKLDTDIQVEQGSSATTYEPYFNGGTATAEMLLKVGDYQDIQSVLDGNVTRKVGVKVLDGTERFTSGQASGVQCITIAKADLGMSSDTLPNDSLDLICTHYKAVNGSDWEQSKLNTIKVGSGYLFFNTQYVQDNTSFKAYLADQYNSGTPVIIVYPLATPTTENVESQPLSIQAGSNDVVITQASIDNLELEVSYKGKEGE